MSSILSIKNSIINLQNFFNDILSPNSAFYLFFGRTTPWTNEPTPDPANNNNSVTSLNIYHDIVGGKLIANSNIAFLIPNVPWVNNSIYYNYDPNDSNLYNENFYIVNQNYSIYKVIDNNYNAGSTIQPQATPTKGTFQTSDGYTWKYMFTIPTLANTTFTSNTYIPVVPNTYVSNNAVPGTIDIVRVKGGGSNYQGYNEGFVSNFINQNSVQLASNAASTNNFYNGCSIYLKAGAGADQIRLITAYNGGTKAVTVTPAFNTFVNLYLGSVQGSFLVGQSVVQSVENISFLYEAGYFNRGDLIVQSDTGAAGYIGTSNSSVIAVNQISSNNFSLNLPIIDTVHAGTIQTGYVTISSGSNALTATTANLLNYSVNNFIQVGSNSNNNVRRITAITNSSVATVDTNFSSNLVANVHYLVSFAATPTSLTPTISNGIITQTNLNSMLVQYGNLSSASIKFIMGETVEEVDVNNISQNSNATVSFVNSTALVLSNINGSISSGYYLVGQDSGLQAQIENIISYPNITLANTLGTFISGENVLAYYGNGTPSGNATVISYNYTPSGTTEYVVSPTVNFVGDGNGAIAYSVVNTSSSSYPIVDVVMINNGNNYTNASATITSGAYGSGANLYPVISPIGGHGANAFSELGAKYAGISVTIDTATNENYYFPSYGSYRQVGIIRDPFFNSLALTVANTLNYNLLVQQIGANGFVNNEIIYQYSTGAAATVVSNPANNSIQINNLNGTLTSNAINSSSNNLLVGLTSGSLANLVSYNEVNFTLNSNTQTIYESNLNIGTLTQVVSNSLIYLTNVSGKISANVICGDPTNNAYANVISLLTTNATINATPSFGLRFNQTTRITLSSNNGTAFQVGEYVTQSVIGATGLVIDTTDEIDLQYTPNHGVFGTGIQITDSTSGATGIITFANTSYLRITGVSGTFTTNNVISTITANGNIVVTFPVLVLGDTYPQYPFQFGGQYVTGSNSGAQGLIGISNTVIYPDLVRNTGKVLYINNLSPFTRSLTSKETFNIVLVF